MFKCQCCVQSLGCPLLDGLYLREADSVQELLCSPSLPRTDILKWICTRSEACLTIKHDDNDAKCAVYI